MQSYFPIILKILSVKMKKFSSILFFASLLAFVACKDNKTTEETQETPAATTEATSETPEAMQAPAADPNAAVPTATLDPAAANAPSDAKAAAAPTGPITSIQFDETTYDYGTVKDGDKVKHIYKFENTGKTPLIISDAKGSCGCTVPDWPREPIAPGKTGEIKVEFDSKNKGTEEGSNQSKRVTITANTDPVQTYLTIKGIVKKDKAGK